MTHSTLSKSGNSEKYAIGRFIKLTFFKNSFLLLQAQNLQDDHGKKYSIITEIAYLPFLGMMRLKTL